MENEVPPSQNQVPKEPESSEVDSAYEDHNRGIEVYARNLESDIADLYKRHEELLESIQRHGMSEEAEEKLASLEDLLNEAEHERKAFEDMTGAKQRSE